MYPIIITDLTVLQYNCARPVRSKRTLVVHTKTNQYQGVNVHLHSYIQSKGGWSSFHTNHIVDLARAINAILPPGYLVNVEQSLQIREFHPATGERIRKPEPDITLYDTES